MDEVAFALQLGAPPQVALSERFSQNVRRQDRGVVDATVVVAAVPLAASAACGADRADMRMALSCLVGVPAM
eukprot:3766798-Alexandrium_andersonii.AAC.1